MSDVRCPSCGDSFRVPDFAVPPGATAKCPWCGDSFSMSCLLVHLPPLAEIFGDDGEPISQAELSAPFRSTATAGLVAASSLTSGVAGTPFTVDHQHPPLGGDLADDSFSESDFDDSDAEFGEAGVTFSEAGFPHPTTETVEWALDSSADSDDTDASGDRPEDDHDLRSVDANDSGTNNLGEEAADAGQRDEFAPSQEDLEAEFGITGPVEPRPLAEATELGLGRENRSFSARPRTKKKSTPLKSILGIVIGGMLAFPIAAGVLALLGKPMDLGFWPFDGKTISTTSTSRSAATPMDRAPRITNGQNGRPGRSLGEDLQDQSEDPPSISPRRNGRSLGGMTPESLENEEQTNDLSNISSGDLGSTEPLAKVDLLDIPPVNTQFDLPPLDLPKTPANQAVADRDAPMETKPEPSVVATVESLPSEPSPPTVTAAPAPGATTSEPAVSTPVIAEPGNSEPVPSDSVAAVSPTEPAMTPAPPVETASDSNAPVTSTIPALAETTASLTPQSAELTGAIAQASEALQSVVSYDGADGVKGQRSRLAVLFAKIAAVGEVASPEEKASVEAVVAALIDADLVKDLAPAAPNWIRYSKRPNNGILATGKLRSEGEKWFVDWSGASPLEIEFSDPSSIDSGTEIIVVGKILESDPAAATTRIDATFIQALAD